MVTVSAAGFGAVLLVFIENEVMELCYLREVRIYT
jgi:hypothetical protein